MMRAKQIVCQSILDDVIGDLLRYEMTPSYVELSRTWIVGCDSMEIRLTPGTLDRT